eukprot:COSAG05_NODE_357_length_10830_cov_5.181810_7_plen_192_part_00
MQSWRLSCPTQPTSPTSPTPPRTTCTTLPWQRAGSQRSGGLVVRLSSLAFLHPLSRFMCAPLFLCETASLAVFWCLVLMLECLLGRSICAGVLLYLVDAVWAAIHEADSDNADAQQRLDALLAHVRASMVASNAGASQARRLSTTFIAFSGDPLAVGSYCELCAGRNDERILVRVLEHHNGLDRSAMTNTM